MKKILFLLMSILLTGELCAQTTTYSKEFKVTLSNPLSDDRNAVLVHIPLASLPKGFNANAFAVFAATTEIASQYNSVDKDYRGIVFIIDKLKGTEKKLITIRYSETGEVKHSYEKKTQAELSHKFGGEWRGREYIGGTFRNVQYLRVPPEHKDHSWFIRYEGPGWESDMVGYRMYLDQRNAVDVFGKRVTEPVLKKIGGDGFDSYHELQDWGMDVLKVGKSLGVGSIGMHTSSGAVRVEKTDSVTCRITEDGDVYSSFLTRYLGWDTGSGKIDLDSRISIHAGTRLTHNRIMIKGSIDNLCTGLIKDEKSRLFTSKGNADNYGYIAAYGKQSLNDDNLGIVIFFKPSLFQEFTEDKLSHIVKLSPKDGTVDFYYAAAWELERNGIKDEPAFIEYVEKTARQLAAPVKIEITKR